MAPYRAPAPGFLFRDHFFFRLFPVPTQKQGRDLEANGNIKHLSESLELWRLGDEHMLAMADLIRERIDNIYDSRSQVEADLADLAGHSHFVGIFKAGRLISTSILVIIKTPDRDLYIPEDYKTAFEYAALLERYDIDDLFLGIRHANARGISIEDSHLALRGIYDYINHISPPHHTMALLEMMPPKKLRYYRRFGIQNHSLGPWTAPFLPDSPLETTITLRDELARVWSDDVWRVQGKEYRLKRA